MLILSVTDLLPLLLSGFASSAAPSPACASRAFTLSFFAITDQVCGLTVVVKSQWLLISRTYISLARCRIDENIRSSQSRWVTVDEMNPSSLCEKSQDLSHPPSGRQEQLLAGAQPLTTSYKSAALICAVEHRIGNLLLEKLQDIIFRDMFEHYTTVILPIQH